jgi:hypothetical protein
MVMLVYQRVPYHPVMMIFLGQSHSLQVLARLAPNFKKSWVPLGGMAVASGNLGALRT